MNDVWARAQFYARNEKWISGSPAPFVGAAATPPPLDQPVKFVPAPSVEDVRAGSAVLEFGQKGEAVRHLQRLLGISDDAKFGKDTKEAVSNFQSKRGIKPSQGKGKVDSTTLAALEESVAADIADVLSIDPRGKTAKIHPELRKRLGMMAEALAKRDFQAMITNGLRTFEEQDAIFKIGRRGILGEQIRTNARGGRAITIMV